MDKVKIVCFSCKFSWGYLGDEPALAAEIKNWVPIICAGKMEASYIVEAFAHGADGVLILGCPEGDCHYQDGNIEARKRLALLRQVLLTHGIQPQRLNLFLSRDPEGKDIPMHINEMAETIKALQKESPVS
ncbi:MAG: hydrogenase iron-sulfur subunit [Dehalococcoidales bacterium]|jgi:coenzyme F420-reducing hydrogenase delta subunit